MLVTWTRARRDHPTIEEPDKSIHAGEPIPAAALERLFQPFYRSALHDREGLGLGLYIAYEIAVAHGGTLSVNSAQKETRFTFRMPTTSV